MRQGENLIGPRFDMRYTSTKLPHRHYYNLQAVFQSTGLLQGEQNSGLDFVGSKQVVETFKLLQGYHK